MRKLTRIINILLAIAVIFGTSGSMVPAHHKSPRISAALSTLAETEPDSIVRVIVQKSGIGNDAELAMRALGGEILNELTLINAFSAKIEAGKLRHLSNNDSVTWVALDAPVRSADISVPAPHVTLRAEFDQADYNADSASWGSDWVEFGEQDGPKDGRVAIEGFYAGLYHGVRMSDSGVGIQTGVDLSAADQTMLSLAFRRKAFETGDQIRVEISLDEEDWYLLDLIQSSGSDAELVSNEYDLSAFQGQWVYLRLLSEINSNGRFYVDYLQLDYLTASREEPEFGFQVYMPIIVQTGVQSLPEALHGLESVDALYASGTALDEFTNTAYSGNDGLISWSGDWVEFDTAGQGPGWGNIRTVYSYYDGGELRLDNYPNTGTRPDIWRRLDLSGGVTGAVLSFDFRTHNVEAMQDRILVQVSGDDGQTFQTLEVIETYSGSVERSRRYDISEYTAGVTRIRFVVDAGYTDPYEYFYVDNVQIAFTTNGSQTVRDEFNTQSYAGDDGLASWEGPWVEFDPDGGYGAYGGYVYVSGERLSFHYTYGNYDYVQRSVNLQGATNASLKFDWDTERLSKFYNISVLVSSDGGAYFHVLDTFEGGENGTANYDLTPYISSHTIVRFQNRGINWVYGQYAFFDNVQISYSNSCQECVDFANLENAFIPAVNANRLWNEPPYLQGQGVTVAVLDSGIAEHINFEDSSGASRILTHVSFTGGNGLPDDFYGHGTHVAGLIASNGAVSEQEYMGIAPKVHLVDVKVLDDKGRGYTSEVVAGLEWIFNNAEEYNIRVVNLSLNSSVVDSYRTNALSAALELLWFKGITVVVAAGNNGNTEPGILFPPANDPYLIAVGALDDHETASSEDDTLASFSSYGVTPEGYSRPDLVAPGSNMTSLISSDSNLVIEHPEKIKKDKWGNNHFQMSGTSMASPVVAGAAALLLQAEPGLTPDQVKARLIETSHPFNAGNNAGYLDVYNAVNTTTSTATQQGYIPNDLLAKMALIAYWASTMNEGEIDWDTVDWETVNWNAVDWAAVNWGSVNWGSVNWGSVNWGSVNWGSVNWGSVNWGSVNWGSVNWGSVNWGSVNWGSVNWGSSY